MQIIDRNSRNSWESLESLESWNPGNLQNMDGKTDSITQIMRSAPHVRASAFRSWVAYTPSCECPAAAMSCFRAEASMPSNSVSLTSATVVILAGSAPSGAYAGGRDSTNSTSSVVAAARGAGYAGAGTTGATEAALPRRQAYPRNRLLIVITST